MLINHKPCSLSSSSFFFAASAIAAPVSLLCSPSFSILNVGSPLLPVLIPRRVADVLLRPNLLNDDVRHAHRFLNAVRVQADGDGQVHPDHGRLIGSLDHALSSFIGGAVGEGRKSHDGGSLRGREREVQDVKLEAVRVAVDVGGTVGR